MTNCALTSVVCLILRLALHVLELALIARVYGRGAANDIRLSIRGGLEMMLSGLDEIVTSNELSDSGQSHRSSVVGRHGLRLPTVDCSVDRLEYQQKQNCKQVVLSGDSHHTATAERS